MTTRCRIAFLLAAVVGCIPAVACSQQASAPASGPGDMSLASFEQRRAGRMMAADTDGDGRISQAEFVAAARSGHADPAARFARLDTNRDGQLDRGEIDAMIQRRFKRMDKDGNGVVTAAERTVMHPAQGQAGDGG